MGCHFGPAIRQWQPRETQGNLDVENLAQWAASDGKSRRTVGLLTPPGFMVTILLKSVATKDISTQLDMYVALPDLLDSGNSDAVAALVAVVDALSDDVFADYLVEP